MDLGAADASSWAWEEGLAPSSSEQRRPAPPRSCDPRGKLRLAQQPEITLEQVAHCPVPCNLHGTDLIPAPQPARRAGFSRRSVASPVVLKVPSWVSQPRDPP